MEQTTVDVVVIGGEILTPADIMDFEPQDFEALLLLDCNCVLPEQSCPACREAARAAYGDEII